MALYIDSAFLNDIMNVTRTVGAIERFTQDWQKMNKL